MLLKEKYNLNHLIKQKRFMILDPFVSSQYYPAPNFKEILSQKNVLYYLEKKHRFYSKSQRLKNNTINTLNSFLNKNKYPFLENHERFKYKQIHTYFRNIISDQKKRTTFAKNELRKTILKTLLSTNQNTFLFTRRMLFNGAEMLANKPLLPFNNLVKKSRVQKAKLKDISQFSVLKMRTRSRLFKTKSIFESLPLKTNVFESTRTLKTEGFFRKNAVGINQNKNRYAKLGPILFLEKTINPLFTLPGKGFSRVRNRCLLSGRSSIVGKYRLSRICFRHYVNCGLVPGFIKNRK
jgi:ribosomal protein S14